MEDGKSDEAVEAGGGSGSDIITKQDSGIGEILDIPETQSPQCNRKDNESADSSASESGIDSSNSPNPNPQLNLSPDSEPPPSTSADPVCEYVTDTRLKMSEACKRVTNDASSDEDSPKSKRHSPGRSEQNYPNVTSSPTTMSQSNDLENTEEEAMSSGNITSECVMLIFRHICLFTLIFSFLLEIMFNDT